MKLGLAWKIARRYFAAKRSHHLINIISKISVAGVCVGTMGLIIVLSVFNGFGNLVLSMYDSFDPDIVITPAKGKFFIPEDAQIEKIKALSFVSVTTYTLEENVLLRYNERQFIATMKGVSESYFKSSDLQSKIIDGSPILRHADLNFMIPGAGIAYSLGLKLNDPVSRINVYLPKKGIDPSSALLNPDDAFSQRTIAASAVFSVQQDFDNKFAIVPIDFIREMMGEEKKISSLEIKLKKGVDQQEAAQQIQQVTGANFKVKDRYQQHDFLYKILKSEKAGVYLILCFILLIATFNVFGSLTMLIIDKKKDILSLINMGASVSFIKKVFFIEGLLISVFGAGIGMLLGGGVCYLQQRFEIIKLGDAENFVTNSYPVAMQLNDFLLVTTIVLTIGGIAAFITSRLIVKRQLENTII
jgi:lipoprotein-releasing system permease protein